jgi:DNA-binding MarR family transcriptional regulator
MERHYQSDLSLDEKVLMAVVRLAETFKRIHSEVFRGQGLSFPQYNVLRVLEASHRGRNSMSAVSRIMLVPGANITGIAKRLAKEGFVAKRPDPNDERVTVLEITVKGRRTLRRIEKEKDARLARMLERLTPAEKEALLAQVKTVLKTSLSLLNGSAAGPPRGRPAAPAVLRASGPRAPSAASPSSSRRAPRARRR